MPITCPVSLKPISQEEFAELDYRVMREAFACHNLMGRLCDEIIYHNDLVARLRSAGLQAAKEIPVSVSHRDFVRTYSLDLIVADAAIYELKTVSSLTGAHEAQLLNYLLLCESHHGKLVNFRSQKIETRFVNTGLTQTRRRQCFVEMDRWNETDDVDRRFCEDVLGLLKDWGCWLDLALYTEALIHLSGGEPQVVQLLALARDNVELGKQRFNLLNPETAFRLTALVEGTEEYENHLRSLLSLSPLQKLHWINLARDRVQLVSLRR